MNDIDLDWEKRNPKEISFTDHMIACSLAILNEHVSVFPIDTLKTHMQCERCIQGTLSLRTLQSDIQLVKDKGIFRLWRGVSATFSGCNPGELH
jgi:solute carrier family 25 (mitochondrial iron transporter), member 28/37